MYCIYGMQDFYGYGVQGVCKGITKRRWEGFKDVYALLVVIDVQWECFYIRLYELSDLV